jgi:CheY-like chemotaxis protein
MIIFRPSGSVPLNVLILEDRRSDADLLLYELRQAGFDPRAKCVSSEQEFADHLKPQLDVILADYVLPGFDAPRALECLRDSGLDIPLIVVSGAVGEDTALATIRLGAADYILKDRLLRLGPAVRDVL